jgi:hypothetical protein
MTVDVHVLPRHRLQPFSVSPIRLYTILTDLISRGTASEREHRALTGQMGLERWPNEQGANRSFRSPRWYLSLKSEWSEFDVRRDDFDWHADEITRATAVTARYRNTQNVHRFLLSECGPAPVRSPVHAMEQRWRVKDDGRDSR